MAITQKFNLPSVLGDEAKRYRELFEKGNNRTAAGSVSFTSATSGTTYNSTSGEAGIFAQLQTALEDYNVDAAWSDEIYGLMGVVPWQAWMYTNFKEQLTPAEIAAIESNSTLMAIINSSEIEKIRLYGENIQVFESDGTFAKPTNVRKLFVEVVGGGGGGAGSSASTDASRGGGGGGYAFKIIDADSLTYPVTVTVGAGGAGGTTGATSAQNGGTGGTSSFGAEVSATGGIGGKYFNVGSADSGAGGIGVGGDINTAGDAGGIGNGGSSFYGGGANVTNSTGSGRPGQPYGGGGSGCANASANGGVGGDGVVIVRW